MIDGPGSQGAWPLLTPLANTLPLLVSRRTPSSRLCLTLIPSFSTLFCFVQLQPCSFLVPLEFPFLHSGPRSLPFLPSVHPRPSSPAAPSLKSSSTMVLEKELKDFLLPAVTLRLPYNLVTCLPLNWANYIFYPVHSPSFLKELGSWLADCPSPPLFGLRADVPSNFLNVFRTHDSLL